MTTTIDVSAVQVVQGWTYDLIEDQRLREVAMAAAGTIRSNVRGAVQKVLEAGHLLQEMKQRLPHGHYLAWVERECRLKPQYASKLIKAAEWANVAHVQHLDGCTDVATLFLLSADTTTEEVREWFIERCAAGDTPSRKEVQERKRSAGQPRAPQPTEKMALALIRKGDIERTKEALALAERSQMVADADVIAELRLRELPKGSVLKGAEADFHRLKDGQWVRMPHAGRVDVEPEPQPQSNPDVLAMSPVVGVGLMSLEGAAKRLGVAVSTLRLRLTPAQGGKYERNGYRAVREGRGTVRVTPVTP